MRTCLGGFFFKADRNVIAVVLPDMFDFLAENFGKSEFSGLFEEYRFGFKLTRCEPLDQKWALETPSYRRSVLFFVCLLLQRLQSGEKEVPMGGTYWDKWERGDIHQIVTRTLSGFGFFHQKFTYVVVLVVMLYLAGYS
jgi:hypothetical protein